MHTPFVFLLISAALIGLTFILLVSQERRHPRTGWFPAALLILLLPGLAHAQTSTDTVSSWLPYLVILGPLLGAILLPLVAWGLARVTGLEAKLHDWLVAHKQSKAADLVDSAWGIIDRWVETSAGVLAGQLTNGDLSWTDRAAWKTKAMAEIDLLEQRAPGYIAQAATTAPAVLAQLMAAVDAKMVAAPAGGATLLPATQLVSGTTDQTADPIADAVSKIIGARTSLATLDAPATPAPGPAASTVAADAAPAAPATVVVNVSGTQAPAIEPKDPALSPGGVILPGFGAPMQTGAA